MWLVIVENFKHSFDQITFRMALSKNYHNSDGSRSNPKVLFFPLVLNNKKEMKAQSTVASSCHSKVRSTQHKGVLFFFCLSHGV